ncbi:MAG: hypothetical protein AAGI23_07170 [Bacteroidota bacterium]
MRTYCTLFISILLSITSISAQKKDSLKITDLIPHTHYFTIENGQFQGDGKAFLEAEMAKHQYVLLGEYHGSSLISQFTETLIPVLAKNDFNTFAIEVGPISGQILSELSTDPKQTTERLLDFNSRYYVQEEDYSYMAIPFFKYIEDAQFLSAAAAHDWALMGLDQEFIYGYEPLIDRLFQNLNQQQQDQLKTQYLMVKDSLSTYYALEASGDEDLAVLVYHSSLIASFLEQSTQANPDNQAIADAIRATTQIYYYNATRKYLQCNSSRIDYMKENLRKGFERLDFDLRQDKMLLKMGGVHTARGFSWLSLFEIGNTLSELANYHGNTSLHINFSSRYYEEDGQVIDRLADTESYTYRYKDILQLAKPDAWTIIDLRPLKYNLFYARKFLVSDLIQDVFKQHDWVILPPVERESKRNFVLRE